VENTAKQDLQFSILKMARGAVEERIAAETGKIVENILDLNTEAKKVRELQIIVKFVPSDDRKTVAVAAQAKSKLQPLTAVPTMLYVGPDSNGELKAIEAVPQTPGQLDFDGGMQADPKVINLGAKQA
jgi:hypothetical protein